VGCAQWKINQPPSLEMVKSELGGRGSSQAILIARGTRGGSSVWLDGLSGSSGEVFGPANQTNETENIDQTDLPLSDQPDQPDRRDRPDEPDLVRHAQ
ncbi:MAG: hypothetical protein ABL983_20075, partial [Nitrospira sp.]